MSCVIKVSVFVLRVSLFFRGIFFLNLCTISIEMNSDQTLTRG